MPSPASSIAHPRPERFCEVYQAQVEAEWDRLLDRVGEDFDGFRTAAWSPDETAYFAWLSAELQVLGDHGSVYDRCSCEPVPSWGRAA